MKPSGLQTVLCRFSSLLYSLQFPVSLSLLLNMESATESGTKSQVVVHGYMMKELMLLVTYRLRCRELLGNFLLAAREVTSNLPLAMQEVTE